MLKTHVRLDIYDWKLYFRTAVFSALLVVYLIGRDVLDAFLSAHILFFEVYHIFWFLLMGEMVIVFFPQLNKSLGCGKVYAAHYVPVGEFSREKLLEETQRNNRRAMTVAGVWIVLIAIIGWLKAKSILERVDFFVLTLFFYMSDQICINIWCPFRVFFMKNKCCNSCRIFNWGHIMMFSPLIFIPSFWTLTLVALSAIITLQWEITLARHPERFSALSNAALRCSGCSAKCKWLEREKRLRKTDTAELS